MSLLFSQYCITVGFCCILFYMYGFFPLKKSSNIFSSKEDFPSSIQDLKFHKEKLYNDSVGKTVLMVIDALRADFVTADNMPYTSRVLAGEKGGGCLLTARVSAPTVTLPRIKAIVTGSVSSYIDVVLNFGTSELMIDNIISQASPTKTLVFYGDETWITLFPHHFTRSDGTSSFFVNDFIEVDNNVTRHLDAELQRSDWGLMILHYLGLDHIGHIEGPKSPRIRTKLREMDSIMADLHTYLQKQGGGLLLVCGDHGMKDSGSHGGVSLPEILVPVVVLGIDCPAHFKEEILQVDLAATLSVLWGAPIPADSIGVAAPALLGHMPPTQRLYAWLYNAEQLAGNFLRNRGSTQHEGYVMYQEAKHKHYEWLRNSSAVSHQQVELLYHTSLISMSRFLSEVFANYDMVAMTCAMAILFQILCMLGVRLLWGPGPTWPHTQLAFYSSLAVSVLVVVVCRLMSLCSYSQALGTLTCVFLLTFHSLVLHHQLQSVPSLFSVFTLLTSISWRTLLPLGTVLFCVSLLSSSLIEEEHQLWYFLWVTVCTLRLGEAPVKWFCMLAAHRFLRTFNQTGDKWAHLPDLSDWLTLPHNRPWLSALFVISLAGCVGCCTRLTRRWVYMPLYLCAAITIYLHKSAVQQVTAFMPPWSPSGVLEARLCWLLLILTVLLTRSLLVCWMLAVCLLLRPYNALLVPSLFAISEAVSYSPSTTTATTVLHHWLGAVFFFYQGNSNSLASVDLAAGYVGLEEYDFVTVGVLLLAHTYAMPIMAYLLNILSIVKSKKDWRAELSYNCELVVFLQLLHALVSLLFVTLHRYHLFIWTVFSPKILYIATQTAVYFFLVTITNGCLCYFKVRRTKKMY